MTTFGLQLPDLAEIAPDERFARSAELAVSAESSGFDSVWMLDHHVRLRPFGAPERPPLEAYSLLGGLATRTSRVRLGAMVGDVGSRSPALLAKVATSLDVIAGGRTAIGFVGSDDQPSDGAAGRLGVLDETVQICRAMFVGDDVSFAGDHFHLEHARNLPQPVQSGGPRILITDGGDGHTLPLAARYADVCGISGRSGTLAATIEELGRRCREIGRDPAEIDVAWLAPCILTTSDERSNEVRAALVAEGDQRSDAGLLVGQPHEMPGLVAGHVDAGADEVIFDFSGADPSSIAEVGAALGLTPSARPTSGKEPRCH
jgi:alkanesulfonate monooxygenase SsuD/methylene tetrahydromethanopterin reductase-like flavin-dependent oxidoreductase (luciferase family)